MKIQYEVGDNVGALAMLYYLPAEGIASIPPAVNGVIEGDIVLAPGAVWNEAWFTLDSLGYEERMRLTPHGEEYSLELKGFLSKYTPGLNKALTSFRRRRLVLLAHDNNGQLLLIGDKHHYLTFESSLSTGSQTSGRNGVSVGLSGKNTHGALFYQGSILIGPNERVNSGRGYLLLENGGRIII